LATSAIMSFSANRSDWGSKLREAAVIEPFTRHPRAVGETYGQHLAMAWGFAFAMLAGGLACLVHGLLPFTFERTGSQCVQRLHERLSRRSPPPSTAATGGAAATPR
jgi:hypothetical protein